MLTTFILYSICPLLLTDWCVVMCFILGKRSQCTKILSKYLLYIFMKRLFWDLCNVQNPRFYINYISLCLIYCLFMQIRSYFMNVIVYFFIKLPVLVPLLTSIYFLITSILETYWQSFFPPSLPQCLQNNSP